MAHERVVSHAGLCVRPAPGCGKTLCPPCPTGAVDEMSVATSLDQADPVAFRVVEDAENEAAEVGRALRVGRAGCPGPGQRGDDVVHLDVDPGAVVRLGTDPAGCTAGVD